MDNLQRATVSISIGGDDLVPDEVTALLGASPNIAARKGEVFLGSNGRPIKARTGRWSFRGGWVSPPDLDRQISDLLACLTEDVTVWNKMTTRFACYLSVGGYLNGWAGGILLQPTTMKLLVDRNLAIDFDLYAPAASD